MRVSSFSVLVCYTGLALTQPLLGQDREESLRNANLLLAPRQARPFTFSFFGEFLYWKLTAAIDYVRTGVGVSIDAGAPEIPVPSTGSIFGPDFKYQPGFRVGGSVYFGKNNAYDITTRYTRFHTNPQGHFSPESGLVATALGFLVEDGSGRVTINSASIHTDFKLNFIDLVGGYSFDVSRHFYLRPFAGLSGQFNDLALKVRYDLFNPVPANVAGEEIHIHKTSMSSWGIGPICGLDVSWDMTKNLSLFGSFNFRTPWTRLNLKAKQKEIRLTAGGEFDILQGKLTVDHVPYIWDFLIGPEWDVWFSKDRYHFSLRTAWEWMLVSGANTAYLNATNADSNVSLEIQGLNVAASFEF